MFDEEDLASIREERERWEAAIETGENVMPPIIAAVKAYVTMGEIMAVFEDHYGSYQETVGLA